MRLPEDCLPSLRRFARRAALGNPGRIVILGDDAPTAETFARLSVAGAGDELTGALPKKGR